MNTTTYSILPRIRKDKFSIKHKGYPIWLRFTAKGIKPAFRPTGVFIKDPLFWNSNIRMVVGGPFARLNNQIIDKVAEEAEERIKISILKDEGPTVAAFKGKVLQNFEAYIRKHERVCAGGVIKNIKECFGSVPMIEMVTVKWLERLEDYMEGMGKSDSTLNNYMTALNVILKQAVKDDYISKSPFGLGLYSIPEQGKTNPKYLEEKERNILVNCLLNNTELSAESYKVLVYAMLGNFAGLRFSDWQQFSIDKHVRDNEIVLVPIKTSKSTKARIHIPIYPNTTLEKIIDIIRKVGPLNLSYSTTAYHLEQIQEILNIKTDLTTHVFRHSFGYLCASLGISEEATAKLMGITLGVVKVYYHYTSQHAKDQSKQLSTV